MHRLFTATAAAVALALSASPAAAGGPGPAATIGGPALATSGVVANTAPGVPPLPTGLAASSFLVADLTTGDVLAAKAPHEWFPPASTLKVLTALTLIPRLNPAMRVRATYAEATVDGSRVGIVPGQIYTVRQLLTAMLVVSGNDAALALASANGGVATTVSEMNAVAQLLNADDTVAGSVDGLDAPGQHSSAYDLALIARAALAMPSFDGYVGTQRAFFPREPAGGTFEIDTHNPLLGVYPGTYGVKNGYTVADDATYIGAARRGKDNLVVVLMHAYPNFAPAAEALLNWGFVADGRVVPVGALVAPKTPPPLYPAVLASPVVSARAHLSDQGGSVALAAEITAACLAGVLAGLRTRVLVRRRLRRRRRRLSLPRY